MKKILILILTLSLLTGCNKKVEEEYDNIVSNINDSIGVSQNVDGITFSNQSIIYQDNISTLTFEITNTLDYEKQITKIYVSVKNENGTEITKLETSVDINLDVADTTILNIYSDIDLSNAYRLEFTYE